MKICRSKAVKICDFRTIDPGAYAPPFEMSDEELNESIEKLLKRHSAMTDADSVKADDIVTIDVSSELPKFNKKALSLRVGRGLYSPELEERLIGMRPGEETALVIDGAEVKAALLFAKRRVLPALTDETVSSLGIEGVDTVEALKAHLIGEARREYVEDMAEAVAVEVSNEANAQSEFKLDEDELNEVIAEGRAMANDMLASAGLDPESASDDEVLAVMGRTKQEHYDFIDEISAGSLKSTAIGAAMMERDDEEILLGEYEEAVRLCAEGMGISLEEAEKIVTYPRFLRQRAANYSFDAILEYVENYLERK